MTPNEIVAVLKVRMTSQLQELGCAGFVMLGYIKDADGNTHRFAIGTAGGDAAIEDGLMHPQALASAWAQSRPARVQIQYPAPGTPGTGAPLPPDSGSTCGP